MQSFSSWPLDSPISFGLSLCLLGFFVLGFVFSIDPGYITRRKRESSHAFEMDRRLGRAFMLIFGSTAVLVLLISWVRGNTAPFVWLDE